MNIIHEIAISSNQIKILFTFAIPVIWVKQNAINMGKGDKKTRRGKIFMGSYGIRRPRKKAKPSVKSAEPLIETKLKDKKPARIKKQEPEIPLAEPVSAELQTVAGANEVTEVKKTKPVKKSKETVSVTDSAEKQAKSPKVSKTKKEIPEASDSKESKPVKESKPKKVKNENKE